MSITVTGASIADARIRWPTSGVLKIPPCPTKRSIWTSSDFNISIPILIAPKALAKWIRMKFAKSKRLPGVRTNNGLPSFTPVMFSPEK